MAKPIKVTEAGVVAEAKGERLARWQKHLENYAASNPVKYADKTTPKDVFDLQGRKVGTKVDIDPNIVPDSFK